ncbi:MAG: DUF169 domain-containing protein [Pseudomonadota bacterium]
MPDLEVYQGYGEELERRLRLKTFPLALKLLEKESDIPDGAQRPLRDFGHHLSLCQAYQMSRRDGVSIAMMKEDNWCPEPVIGYGLGEAPQYFLEGYNRYPHDVENLEAGSHYARELPRLDLGKYVGVASAPLTTTRFVPDLVMIYCDSPQLNLILLAREYREGYNLKCSLSSHAACVYGVVPAVLSGECQVAVPCRGDRYRAMAGDDEMIFTVPQRKLGDLMSGIAYVNSHGSRLPRAYPSFPEYPMRESYEKIAKMRGYL